MPSWRDEIRRRLAGRALARPDEIVEELAQHLDDHCAELVRSGTPPQQARQLTLDQLASEDALRRALEPVERPAPRLSGLGADLRYALRGLRARPVLSGAALLT